MLHLAEREKRYKRTQSLKSGRRRELIVRPAGKSGSDWNLCERMGLIRRKRTYDKIRVRICAYIHVAES